LLWNTRFVTDDQISALKAANEALQRRVDGLESWAGSLSAQLAGNAAAATSVRASIPTSVRTDAGTENGGSTSRRNMLIALGAGVVGGAAAGAVVDYSVDPHSSSKTPTSTPSTGGTPTGYRPQPYRDAATGMYLPEGFGSLTDEAKTTQAIQTAIDAASAAGGGAVLLSGTYTVAPSAENKAYALSTRDNVTLAGVDWATSQITLAKGANCSVVSGKGDKDSAGRVKPTEFFAVRDLTINGNRTGQSGNAQHHGLYLVRHKHLRISGVRITECDGNGYHSSGAVAGQGTEVTRPIFVTDMVCDNNNGWGMFSSATNREFHGKGIHVEANGITGSNEYGGAFLDHSEDIILGLTARNNLGDGIWIHNVQACHYDNLHSFGNDGFGIYVQGLVGSEGRNWLAAANCGAFKSATYRPQPTPTAEVYFTARSGSYGTSKNSRVDGVHAPGDKSFAGNKPDNRNAAWGIFVEDGVNPANMRITNFVPGDGGLTGAIRLPAH